MKWIVLITLVISFAIGVICSICLLGYIKELRKLPSYDDNGDPDDYRPDGMFYFFFGVSLLFTLLSLTSCTIIVLT